ncbi:hypothetical protein BDV59DRAFT_188862 [Aspergillus ambiguus]|uniref:Zn(II)2Cys6 transcription factor domain-containing protein n=1 Tax=Aspergillus ambiguus TaxID=176160 RepID=UPI003CCD26BD
MEKLLPGQRQLAPKPPSGLSKNSEEKLVSGPSQYLSNKSKRRAPMACLSCKKLKRKCSGYPTCDTCRVYKQQCIFDSTSDRRRRVAEKQTAAELCFYRTMLNDLIKILRAKDKSLGSNLLQIIRKDTSMRQIREAMDDFLSPVTATEDRDKKALGTKSHTDTI